MFFCAYCGVNHDESVRITPEHIVPYAIGGTDQLTIPVCEESNNKRVDSLTDHSSKALLSEQSDISWDSMERMELSRRLISAVYRHSTAKRLR